MNVRPVNQNAAPREIAGGLLWILRICDLVTDIVGVIGGLALIALTTGIVLGIGLREIGIDNTWTYDFDLYGLVWTAFVGAVLTARQGRHVTAGIALELYTPPKVTIFVRLLRALLVIAFLCLLTYAGWVEAASSYSGNETTIDVAQWPVWIAKIALPIGAGFWGLVEIARTIRLIFDLPDPKLVPEGAA
ncbi:TRAP transporter small permease [Thioclava sp. BHET1]|nr:TRAP transporter small permease [Thioclava sp. BHET1]